MKKFVVKIAVFLFCFVLGAGLVELPGFFISQADGSYQNHEVTEIKVNPEIKAEPVVEKRRGSGIEVKFKEIVDSGTGLVADFEITNFEDVSFYYHSYHAEKPNEPLSTLYRVKINGKEENMGWCGTGLQVFELKSGVTKTFRVYNLSYPWKKEKGIQYGFNFGKGDDKEFRTFWSETLPINDSIAKQLSKEKEKYNQPD